MWIAAQGLPRSAGHPFYTRLNQILDQAGFDEYVEALCQRFCADEIGRSGLPPGRCFRLLLIGYFEGLGRRARHRMAGGGLVCPPRVPRVALPEAPRIIRRFRARVALSTLRRTRPSSRGSSSGSPTRTWSKARLWALTGG
jgi:hypothetical protein